jgi:hypothetical protein
MNTIKSTSKVGVFILAFLLLSGFTLFSNTTVQAQRRRGRVIIVRPIRPYPFGWGYRDRFWGGYPYDSFGYYNQYVFKNSESAFNRGYQDGAKTGSSDGRKNKSYNPERSHYFQEAGYGNFAEAYRDGFSRGYHDGFRRVG